MGKLLISEYRAPVSDHLCKVGRTTLYSEVSTVKRGLPILSSHAISYGVPDTFGKHLSRCIKDAGLQKGDVAHRLGVSPQHISDLVAGRRSLNPKHFEKLADILGLHGRERQRFIDLAMVRNIKASLRPYYEALITRLQRVEERQDEKGPGPSR